MAPAPDETAGRLTLRVIQRWILRYIARPDGIMTISLPEHSGVELLQIKISSVRSMAQDLETQPHIRSSGADEIRPNVAACR